MTTFSHSVSFVTIVTGLTAGILFLGSDAFCTHACMGIHSVSRWVGLVCLVAGITLVVLASGSFLSGLLIAAGINDEGAYNPWMQTFVYLLSGGLLLTVATSL